MILHPLINEPELEFNDDKSICPRQGIAEHGVYDLRLEQFRRKELFIGAVGTPEGLEKFQAWLDRCAGFIEPKIDPKAKRFMPNFHYPFYGFNEDSGFRTKIVFGEVNTRRIKPEQIEEIIKLPNKTDRIKLAVDIYYDRAKYLNDHRTVDVIVCVLPNSLVEAIYRELKDETKKPSDDELESIARKAIRHSTEKKKEEIEQNFRRELKARALISLEKPLQLVMERTIQTGDSGNNQPEATRAWNFFTALYYKKRESIPWKMVTNRNLPTTCYVGISFYKSRDRKSLHTSLAQIFDERGQGVILRGAEITPDKDDPRPFLTERQAYELLARALSTYRFAMESSPGRLVLHKSSNFRAGEISGFKAAAQERQIDNVDIITIQDSDFRLYRKGIYPPYRGTHVELTKKTHLLYTRGSVEYYQTYPGQYIPQPLEVRIVESTESARLLCEEILALTKMNWNNTQFDGKKPITLVCGYKVGEILKYLQDVDDDRLKINYCYYM